MDAGDWISLFAVGVAAVGFGSGLYQYGAAQRWKRAEFVAKEYEAFEADAVVNDALKMLDWGPIRIKPRLGDGEEIVVSHADLRGALRLPTEAQNSFSDKETIIRLTFDDLFSKLGRFNHYIRSDLITKKDIDPYIHYWMDVLCARGIALDELTCRGIWIFLEAYDYRDTLELLQRYGCKLPGEGRLHGS